MRVLVIGGSDAGISAGLRARECDPHADVTLIVADDYPNYSICGLPFFLSGETPDWRDLAHRTRGDLEGARLRLRLGTVAVAVHPDEHEVSVEPAGGGHTERLGYDRLVIATGAQPARPPIDGLDLPGVHLLHTMDDAFALRDRLTAAGRAVVVGAGYIGVEMADALTHRGLDVHLLEMADTVLTTVDPPLGALIRNELEQHGVTVSTSARVRAIAKDGDSLTVVTEHLDLAADVVVVAPGVRPAVALGAGIGIPTGAGGALVVDTRMRTGIADIFAAGDCVHTHHRLLPEPVYMPLGTTAHKQGRVAGANSVGGDDEFTGVLGTQVVKVFDAVAARTGLNQRDAERSGYDAVTTQLVVDDHKGYYPGATDLHIRVTGDRSTGRLLGAQIVGRVGAEVAKRIDVFATALFHGMAIADVDRLDLTYTPPLGAPWDAVQSAAQNWVRAARAA